MPQLKANILWKHCSLDFTYFFQEEVKLQIDEKKERKQYASLQKHLIALVSFNF